MLSRFDNNPSKSPFNALFLREDNSQLFPSERYAGGLNSSISPTGEREESIFFVRLAQLHSLQPITFLISFRNSFTQNRCQRRSEISASRNWMQMTISEERGSNTHPTSER